MKSQETSAAALWLSCLGTQDRGPHTAWISSYLPWVQLQLAIWACGGPKTGEGQHHAYDGLVQGAKGDLFLPFVPPARALEAGRQG